MEKSTQKILERQSLKHLLKNLSFAGKSEGSDKKSMLRKERLSDFHHGALKIN